MPKYLILMPKYLIYKIYCDDNDEIYIGSTNSFKRRYNEHKRGCDTKNNLLYVIIRGNGGWDNWIMTPIEECNTKIEAIQKEQYWIETLKASLNCANAYTARTKEEQWEHCLKIFLQRE